MPNRYATLALLATAVCGAALVAADVTTLWPLPTSVTSGTTDLLVSPALAFTFSGAASCQAASSPAGTFLAPAFQRYNKYIFWYTAGAADAAADGTTKRAFADVDALMRGESAAAEATANVTQVVVCVQSASLALALGTDESYELSLPVSGQTTLTAATVYGALRALETFAQLVEYDESRGAYHIAGAPLSVSDKPRFAWRGFMIDTARHYLPLSTIYRTVDALSFNKFNVLHWHVVDAQSFPYVSQAYPQLAAAGAWHPSAVYTAQDISGVVAYAQARGLRVVPEFDGPGHAGAWGFELPITTNCPDYNHNINNINLNPANNMTLQVLAAVYAELAGLFPDAYFHLGGDEVVEDCWSDDPQVVAWMNAHGLDTTGTYQYFLDQMTALVKANGKKVMNWEDPFDNGLSMDKATTVEVWMDQATLQKVVAAGYNAILAAGFYLDKQIPNPAQTFYEFEDTWKNFYANDPEAGVDTTARGAGTVLGGEGAMWAEQISQENFDGRVWPRACAIAERLWSAASVTDAVAALPRIDAQSCRMSRRGIQSGPLKPGFCLKAPASA